MLIYKVNALLSKGRYWLIIGLILEIRRFHIDAVFTNHARKVLLGTGQITEASHCFHFAQVDYQLVGISDIINGHPESGFLQVEYLIRRTVSAACLFAIGITDFPMFAGYGFAVGSQHIELCNSGNIVIGLRRECFQTEETSFHRSGETYFLPAVARSEGSFVRNLFSCQLQLFSIVAMCFRCFLAEYVEDRFLQTFD